MLEIIVSILLGAIVGILLAKYILSTPIDSTKPFQANLARYGLSGGFAIGTPVIAFLTFLKSTQYQQESILAYFATLLGILFIFASLSCFLVVKCAPRKIFPLDILMSYRARSLLLFLFEGYPALKKNFKNLDNFFQKCIDKNYTTSQELYDQLRQSSSPAEKEILDVLKCTPEQFEHICTTIRKHYFDPH